MNKLQFYPLFFRFIKYYGIHFKEKILVPNYLKSSIVYDSIEDDFAKLKYTASESGLKNFENHFVASSTPTFRSISKSRHIKITFSSTDRESNSEYGKLILTH